MRKLLVLFCLLVSVSSFAQTLKIEEIFGSMPGEGPDTLAEINLNVKRQVITNDIVSIDGFVKDIKVISQDSMIRPFSFFFLYTKKVGKDFKGNALLDEKAYPASCSEYQYNPGKVYCYINAFPNYSGFQLYFELKK